MRLKKYKTMQDKIGIFRKNTDESVLDINVLVFFDG